LHGRIDPVFISKHLKKVQTEFLFQAVIQVMPLQHRKLHARRRWISSNSLWILLELIHPVFISRGFGLGKKWVDVVNNVIDSVRAKVHSMDIKIE
jgi:hypothetical protein